MNRFTPAIALVAAIESLQLLVAVGVNAQARRPHPERACSRVLLEIDGNAIHLDGCERSTDDRLLAFDLVDAEKAGYRIVSRRPAQ